MEVIRFMKLKEPYGAFGNFYVAPFKDSTGTEWKTNEHYYQAMKFSPESMMYDVDGLLKPIRMVINQAHNAWAAAKLGRRTDLPMREDWDEVKELYMFNGLRYKFTQHNDLRTLLVCSYPACIIENNLKDSYWGCGPDDKGLNRLGNLLMKLRFELREEDAAKAGEAGVVPAQ
jgi:ribA/ribD-fused uncharacterized protein